jgi:nitrogen regulatory protein P-II 1
MMLVTAVIRPHKLDKVRAALMAAGAAGMTVSPVTGYGRQAGHREVYRGQVWDTDASQRIKLELVVNDGAVGEVIDQIVDAAETELVGDGKIWALPVVELVRIRTGESGADAL